MGKSFFTLSARMLAALCLLAMASACGLGKNTGEDAAGVSDPIVAATVNGRPIYNEDVRAHAVLRGLLEEGEDLNADTDAFYQALEELIQYRLFALEAEARGLDRDAIIRRRIAAARERVLAAAIYEDIDKKATDPKEIDRLYRENTSQLSQGQEVRLRHMQFVSSEAAAAAKRRLDAGEEFTVLAFELSTDRDTAADGGDVGFQALSDLRAEIRQVVSGLNVGQVAGPVEIDGTWQLVRLDDRRERGAPSLESLRPRIVEWLRFQEISRLQDKLEADARIVRRNAQGEPQERNAPAEAPQNSEDGEPQESPVRPAPPGRVGAPAFPFPMGPGGVSGQARPARATPAPAPAADETKQDETKE